MTRLALGLGIALWLTATPAGAQTLEEWHARAVAAEADADPQTALELYRRARDADPEARLAQRAERRIAWLEARREGDFRPLAALMAIRLERQPSAEVIAAFERAIDGFPPGLVRREARAFCAQAYLRLGPPAEEAAIAAYDRWLAEPDLSPTERERALRARALLKPDGLRSLESAGLEDSAEARHLRMTTWLRVIRIATGSLAALFAFATLRTRPSRRPRPLPLLTPSRLAIAAYLFAVPVVMVWRYDPTFTRAALAVAIAGTLGLTTATAVGGLDLPPRRRPLLALLAFGVQLGVGILALEGSGTFAELFAPWF
ncbi:MAG: hypothetical protein KC731_24965 [Myxococcales bacterium]|nr:hypothetical protein [Myxococcales bacterium]